MMSPPFPRWDGDTLPTLSLAQMREVDRIMVQHYRIDLLQMMELAGRHLAHLARLRFLDGDPRDNLVLILAGKGGNGGGALVCARRLATWGATVSVGITHPLDTFTPVAAQHLQSLQFMGIPMRMGPEIATSIAPKLIIDGMLGYQSTGAPHGETATMIGWANAQAAPILALDLPSGLDATTGIAAVPTVRATATMTLALPKVGLGLQENKGYVGELYLADIGVISAVQ